MKNIFTFMLICLSSITLSKGQTWQLHQQRSNLELSDLHFINTSTGFVFGDSSISGVMVTGVVLKTLDGGVNWTTHTLGNPNYRTTKAHILNANELFSAGRNGGGNSGLFIKSIDGGATWINPVTFNERLFNVYFINSSTGWVLGKNGLLQKTTDGGLSWIPQNISGEDMLCMKFFANNTIGLIGCGGGELYRTTDGGNSWNAITSTVADGLLAIDIVGNEAWLCGEAGSIIHSSDDGQTWTAQNAAVPVDFSAISFANNSNGWMGGVAGIINATVDGGTSWQNQTSNTSLEITGLSVPDINHGWYCDVEGGIYSFNTATSLLELNELYPSITIFPNPATSIVNIVSKSKSEIELIITNEIGQIIQEHIIQVDKTLSVDISELKSGIYYIVPAVNTDRIGYPLIIK